MKAFAWSRPTIWAVLLAQPLLAGGVITHFSADEARSDEKKKTLDARQLSAEEVAEILKIRRALGGPVSSPPASPSILPGGEPQAFRRALQAVKVTPPTPGKNRPLPSRLGEIRPIHAPEPAFVAMRRAARKLDDAAADLEEIGSYTMADRLRGIAASLRLEARALASPGGNTNSKTE